jgi:hypothetical protein
MRLLLRFCASCAFLRPSLLVLFAAFAGHLAAQPAPVLADPTTGALYRPGAATFASYNNLLTLDGAAGSYLLISTAASTYLPITVAFNSYQQLDADLTSWAAVVRAGGFDTFVATPSSANLATLVTGETGSGALVFGTSPTFTTPTLGAATATSLTGATDLTLAGGSTGASLVLGQGTTAGSATLTATGTGTIVAATAAATRTALDISNTSTGPTKNGFRILGPNAASADSRQWAVIANDAAYGDLAIRQSSAAATDPLSGSTALYVSAARNLLIGTTTDIAGTGGLHVAGTGTASTTTSGALRVGSNVGLSGNAGGASYFGGAATFAGAVTTGGAVAIAAPSSQTGLSIDGTTYPELAFRTSGVKKAYATYITANGGIFPGSLIGDLTFRNDSGQGFIFGTSGAAALITVRDSGATFAGAVSIAGTVIHTLSATPASASATGTVGTMSWDANYIYICTATNTWKRVAIATW